MQTVPVLLAAYAAVAGANLALLIWTWRDADNGLNPLLVAGLWPIVLPLLAAYYAAAACYTCAAILRGRQVARPAPAGDPNPVQRA